MNSKTLYISPLELASGSLIVTMGIIELLKSNQHKVAFFRPIIDDINKKDHNISFLLEQYSLDISYNDCYGFDTHQVEQFIANNQFDEFIESIIQQYKQLETRYDFIIIEGLSNDSFSKTVDFDINLKIAQNLGTPYINIVNGKDKTPLDIYDEVLIEIDSIKKSKCTHIATIINRIDYKTKNKLQQHLKTLKTSYPPVYLFDEIDELDMPSLFEVKENLNCTVILGKEDDLKRVVRQTKIASMRVDNFLKYIEDGDLIIVSADRSDIILGVLGAIKSKNFPSVCGILLTGDMVLHPLIKQLLDGLDDISIPILGIQDDTYTASVKIMNIKSKITVRSDSKIALAMGLFLSSVDIDYLKQKIISNISSKIITPTMFEYFLYQKAIQNKQTIVLPESDDERILRATEILLRRDIVNIVLLGDKSTILAKSKILNLDISKATFINPNNSTLMDKYIEIFYNLRKHKGLTLEVAKQSLEDVNYFGTMMVYCKDADGMVSGATHTTQSTIRPALQIIKTKPNISIVSSLFFMCFDTKVLIYADCAINQDPNEQQLAQIAITTAQTTKAFGIEPKVAMLSYSTGESGKGADVEKVQHSTQIIKQSVPELLIEGPIQYDAAIDKTVAKKKLPNSKVAGEATVFIFPDLNTGNNTYKAVQRSSGAIAIGPILQGLNKPINDLSRGCLVSDIVNTVAITAIQAQKG